MGKALTSQDIPANIWRKSPKSSAAIKLSETSVAMIGGPDHALVTDEHFGNIIKGPVSMTATPQQIRISGFWTLNPFLTSMIPSTIITPMPTLIFNPPLGGIEALRQAVRDLTSLIV